MAYTYKFVNGVKIALTSADQAALAAKDAAGWSSIHPPAATTTVERLARLADTFDLTAAELKAEIFRP